MQLYEEQERYLNNWLQESLSDEDAIRNLMNPSRASGSHTSADASVTSLVDLSRKAKDLPGTPKTKLFANNPRKLRISKGNKQKRTQQRERVMNIGCWNVQSLNNKHQEVLMKLKQWKMDIAVLTEIKKKSQGNLLKRTGLRNKAAKIYNMNEKGCRLTLQHQQKVLAAKGAKRVHLIAQEHVENVTIVACANGLGQAIPLAILFKGIKPTYSDGLSTKSKVMMTPNGTSERLQEKPTCNEFPSKFHDKTSADNDFEYDYDDLLPLSVLSHKLRRAGQNPFSEVLRTPDMVKQKSSAVARRKAMNHKAIEMKRKRNAERRETKINNRQNREDEKSDKYNKTREFYKDSKKKHEPLTEITNQNKLRLQSKKRKRKLRRPDRILCKPIGKQKKCEKPQESLRKQEENLKNKEIEEKSHKNDIRRKHGLILKKLEALTIKDFKNIYNGLKEVEDKVKNDLKT
ncbi:hypothetical protein ILUMI_03843 [Ignelater luminosus]|uniref:Uncharacterized protein n=1 Tax=Ignelater luminosus TaxID=2038154 RepID=A0A8K0DF11_IGNLU|nr:hypothetical protein ILUMI_03843 [Ignelater luminosus]